MAADLGKLFGRDSVAGQLITWNVLGQILAAVLAPELELLSREVNKILPATPLSPEQLADMVVRNIVEAGAAQSYASESGVNGADFQRLVHSAGEAPSPQELIMALRRGVIPHDGTGPDSTSFEQGIAESRLYNKWRSVIEAIAHLPLSVADAVDAVVKGHIDYATGEHYAFLNGVDATEFKILEGTRGNPPSPSELATLLKRGLIPLDGTGPDAVTFQQGIFEGASLNKWWEFYARLADYIPPPRTVTTLVHDGAITDAEALAFFQASGLSEELAAKFLDSAHRQRTAAHRTIVSGELRTVARRGYADGHLTEVQFRDLLKQASLAPEAIDQEVIAANLAKTYGRHTFSVSQIKKQRQSGLIDDAQALVRLVAAGWSEEDAQAQIDEWNAEAKVGRTGFTESRVLAYLKAGILTSVEAYNLLTGMGIKSSNATFLVQHPETVPAVKTHGSTAADIVAAYKDGILNLEQTRAKLIEAGDTADAADLKLQVAHYVLNRGPKPKLAHKNLTETQVLEAFRLGLVSDTWTLRELVTLGHDDAGASLLVAIEETKRDKAVPASWVTLT